MILKLIILNNPPPSPDTHTHTHTRKNYEIFLGVIMQFHIPIFKILYFSYAITIHVFRRFSGDTRLAKY